MQSSREAVSIALFNLLDQAFDWKSSSRHPKLPENTTATEQPAMFLIKGDEADTEDQVDGLTKYILDYKILVYARADADPNTTGETLANALLDAIDKTLQSVVLNNKVYFRQGEKQTLGGLVDNAWLEGTVWQANGVIDQQIVLIIPVKVRCGN